MSLKWTTLDVFTDQRYRGNPVAIIQVPISTTLSQSQKQFIAKEFNLSESVFLHERTEEDRQKGDVRIDIFTPIAEIPFAGHPTVGTSNYLLYEISDQPEWNSVQALQAKAGRIPIEKVADGKGITLAVAHNVKIHQTPFPNTPFSHYPVVSIVKGMTFILAPMESLADLAKPTQNLLGTDNTYKRSDALDEGWRQGPVISYFYVNMGVDADGTRQIRTRMLGSREDPATGSAASALTSYLTLSEKGPLTRKYIVTQGVEMGRESRIGLQVSLTDDGSAVKEVLLSGSAVKVMEGTLLIPSPDLVYEN